MVVRILATPHPDVRIIWEAHDIYNAAREPNLDQGLGAGVVIVDAKKLLSREWEVHLLHILREANSCAHFMAKHGARNLAEICIRENPPPGLSALLLADSMGTRYHRGD
ncbi:hypothetical protein NC652_023517 [Populus alba x Populus x berolinensis]|nr:hypothetical protein NC652_023517 [Populus alba x Populus x berolinensis]